MAKKRRQLPLPKRRRGRRIPRTWQPKFLDALARCGIVSQACEETGVSLDTAYDRRKRNEITNWPTKDDEIHFADAWKLAIEKSVDTLEAEARRRAQEGYDEPVFQNGECVGYKRRYSDSLLIFLLKANRPEKYREQISHSHDVRGKITLQDFVTSFTNKEEEEIE